MANLPHRDIFVGMVAEELAKDGYFGEEVNMYAFYVWHGEMHTVFFENEDECVREMLILAMKGALVSEYVLYKTHIDTRNERVLAEIKEQAAIKLAEQENDNIQKQIAEYAKKEFHSREAEFAEYLSKITIEQATLVNSVLLYGLQNKMISLAFADKWRQEEKMSKWSGFAYFENEQIKYYANAYLPNTWQKWRKIRQRNILASSIISMDMTNNKPIYEQKDEFLEYLQQNFDESFFVFLKKIKP